MWTLIHLEPITSGCPNRCRHCSEEGGPPIGALMSLEEVKWVVGEFERACRDTVGNVPQFRLTLDTFEPTTHREFIRLVEYVLSFIPESRRHEHEALGTNGYGLARRTNWEPTFYALMSLGIRSLGFAVHGVEEEHDWFVRRKGAYRDIEIAAQRALAVGMTVQVQVYPSKRNLKQFPAMVEAVQKMGAGRAKIFSAPAGYCMNDRLRAYEALRITKSDRDLIADALSRAPDNDSNTEAFWTRYLAEEGKNADLCTYEPAGRGPDERKLGLLRVTPTFDLIEKLDSRPSILHGNIKRDRIDSVWRSVLETTLPPMPEPDALAHLYGDFESEALHPGADSVYMKLCDKYWLGSQKREMATLASGSQPRN